MIRQIVPARRFELQMLAWLSPMAQNAEFVRRCRFESTAG